MLYLNPPFFLIDGISIYPDHADPLQFYYLPVAPRLTQIKDKASGKMIPQIQIIKFRSEAGTGGFINFDVDLSVDQNKLDTISEKLRLKANLSGKPKLAPVPVIDGSVKLILLGTQTGDNPSADPDKLNFVTKIVQNTKPALYGGNQAVFSASLDQYGVTVLENAIQDGTSPIGVVYSLDYLALRPAYSMKLHADWDRVQKHLDQRFSIDSLVFSLDIDKVVDELIENRAIVIEADTFVSEGEDTSGIIKNKNQALNEIRDMVTDAFFKPSLDPVKKEEDSLDKAVNVLDRLTKGYYKAARFSYQKVDMTRIDKKILNANISERTTVRRSIYPQGHLIGILKEEGLKLEDFITEVKGDPWFARRRVEVSSLANFEGDSIHSINVKMVYGNEPENIILDSDNLKRSVEWVSEVESGSMKRDIRASYTVNFKNVDGIRRPAVLKSPEKMITDNVFQVNPRELYSIISVPVIAADNFPWDRYPAVEVKLQYSDELNGINISHTATLDENNEEKFFPIFTCDPEKTSFNYRVVYYTSDNKPVDKGWNTGKDEISLRDPFPRKLKIEVVPSLDWSDVKQVFVDLSYEDAVNDIFKEDSMKFSETADASQYFIVDLANPESRLVTYQVTVLFRDGRFLKTPQSLTRDRRIIVRSDMKGHRIIPVHPQCADFASKNLKEVSVDLHYEDSDAGLKVDDTFTFKSSDDTAYFEFDYVDEQKPEYCYKVTYHYANGLSRTEEGKNADGNELRIPVA